MSDKFVYAQADKVRLLFTRRFSLHAHLSTNVVREVCRYLGYIALLPSVHFYSGTLVVHDLHTSAKWELICDKGFSGGIAYCLVAALRMICVGGTNDPRAAFTADLRTGMCDAEEQMLHKRKWPGIARFEESVYVFGGNVTKALKSCERFDIATRKWTRCADMSTPKVCFTPCIHEAGIYLPEITQLEVYFPKTDKYLQLPFTLNSPHCGSVSFIAAGELVLINKSKRVYSWPLDSYESQPRVTDCQIAEDCAFTNSPPLLDRKFAYWADGYGGFVKFDLGRKVIAEES